MLCQTRIRSCGYDAGVLGGVPELQGGEGTNTSTRQKSGRQTSSSDLLGMQAEGALSMGVSQPEAS